MTPRPPTSHDASARPARSLSRVVRSRKLAVALIGFVIAYSALATFVPQLADGSSKVASWQAAHPLLAVATKLLGMHAAYGSPLFLVAMLALAVSTTACAWERTQAALRARKRAGSVTEADARRLKQQPHVRVAVEGDPAAAMEAFAGSATAAGFKVRRGPKVAEISAGRIGLFGSPAFHWALALLFVVIAFGRLSRAEGLVGVPLRGSVSDIDASYVTQDVGPLYPGHSGLTIAAKDLVLDYRDASGYRRGPSPRVTLSDRSGRVLRSQRVYPNNPLRYRTLLVHAAGHGALPVFSVRIGSQEATAQAFVDFDGSLPLGSKPATFEFRNGETTTRFYVSIPTDIQNGRRVERLPDDRVAEVSLSRGGRAIATLRPGGSTKLPDGTVLRLDSLGYYVRLSVADDWSVYPMYALFVFGVIALSVSLLVPYRAALVSIETDGGAPSLNVLVRSRRGQVLFAERIESLVEEAAAVPSTKGETA